MAHDPRKEDYQRLGLRFARSLEGGDEAGAVRAFATFGRRFAQNRDSLPQSDADRAFHLVALATDLIDYKLPFATDDEAEKLIVRGHELLGEALALDPFCYDALRMSTAGKEPSFEAYLRFLAEQEEQVAAGCEQRRREASSDAVEERALLSADIAMRPYRRWLATMSEMALICGRNREALRLGEQLLELDPLDSCDVRFTMALAHAKLEDEAALDMLEQRMAPISPRNAPDAWVLLARIALAHKQRRLSEARELLDKLVKLYPAAVSTLVRQSELPDGVFSRLAVQPYSEDELILAVSEATVLLQEGAEMQGHGVLGLWLADAAAHKDPAAAASAMVDMLGSDKDQRS